MKSGAIRGEQVFLVCHVYNESVMVTTIAILFNNYDYNALSTELNVVKTWAGPVSASQLRIHLTPGLGGGGVGIFCVVLQSFSNHYAATDNSIFFQH